MDLRILCLIQDGSSGRSGSCAGPNWNLLTRQRCVDVVEGRDIHSVGLDPSEFPESKKSKLGSHLFTFKE